MAVTTRSQVKKAVRLGVSKPKSKSGEIKEKTWRDWMTNWAVMDKARELWTREIFRKKQLEENPALLETHRFRYVAKREWDSIADTEKAPFITKALDALAPGPVLAGALNKKFVRKTKKQTRESELCHAFASFRGDYYENHFMTHSSYNLTEVKNAACRAWASLDEGIKAPYIAEGKKREADTEEVIKYLQHNETYKGALNKKVVRKTSKQTRESELCHAFASFRGDYYENHFMTHSSYKLTEVKNAACRAWASLDEGVKAPYIAEGKKREADTEEVIKYLQHNETYKARLLSYMF